MAESCIAAEDPSTSRAVEEHGIQPIDMVVVNLYAFEKTAAKPGVHFEELIENIDIGGPSMVRSAAKNFQDVAIVTSPSDYAAIADEMRNQGGSSRWKPNGGSRKKPSPLPPPTILRLLRRWSDQRRTACRPASKTAAFPTLSASPSARLMDLRYGENPHQKAAMYSDGSGAGVANAQAVAGQGTLVQQHRGPAGCVGPGAGIRRAGGAPSSSTPTLAARRPARLWPRPTRRRWSAIRCRPSAASSG